LLYKFVEIYKLFPYNYNKRGINIEKLNKKY